VEIAGESELNLRHQGRLGALCFALLCCSPQLAAAQFRSHDSLPRITAITLDRHSIFDRSDSSWVSHLVNSLHVTTRAPLIRREFLFHTGEPFDSARVAETSRNLRALGVFRDVQIDSSRSDSGIALHVVTRDGWTTRPDFRFRSTGGSIAYTLALIEDNLLGTLTQTELLYQKDPDRSTTVLAFSRRRLIAGKITGAFQYASRSDGELAFAQLALPYFQEASPRGATLTLDDRRDRIFQYRDGVQIPRDTVQNRYVLGRADYSAALYASPFGYLRVGGMAQVRRDDYVSDAEYQATGAFPGSVTGAVGAYVEAEKVRKPTVHGFRAFGRAEDVDLSSVVRLSLFAAPSAFGYGRGHAGIAPGLAAHSGIQFPGGLAYADIVASGLYTASGLDSGQVLVDGTVALMPASRHQLVVHGEFGALKNPIAGTEFDLGLGAGPRAFSQHSFTGDREFFATAEYRYTLTPEVLKVVGIGLAAFVDHGGAWWSGDPHRTGWDYGVGLRLGASRAPELDANRIDLAWRAAQPGLPGGWVLAVGKGFVFSAGPRGTSR
jgi:hypothetical protein